MKPELVFCDVDGTLIDDNHQILDDTKKAVRALNERGVPFVIATGRTPLGVLPLMRSLGSRAPFIASNGGFVGDENAKVLAQTGFDLKTALKIRDAARDFLPEAECTAYCAEKWVVENPDSPAAKEESRVVGVTASKGKPEDCIRADGVVQKWLFIDPKDKMPALAAHLKKIFPDFVIFVSNENMLEVLPRGISKAWGAREVCRLLNIAPENTVAFGDGVNDLGLFEFAGLSVAMGNAPEDVRQKASRVTTSHNENGIARVLDDVFDLGLF